MGKFVVICILIILGLFGVLMINNNSTKIKPSAENSVLNIPSISLSPSSDTIISMKNQISTPSSQTEITKATIKTEKGDIELTLYSQDAPNTVANFISKAKSGFYNNLIFHRVEDWVIQGGDPDGNGTGGGKILTELNNKPFIIGSLGVARGGDINVSNDAQFFVTKTDALWLNNQYTNFGIVTKGIDIVNNIEIGDRILKIELKP
ncbi:MAG: peptidylprolyl isomerase [Candidatus Levybacteria bacterium]|nr:peptidylprolyl isomerase [Candidatus Levybacteria bacterium]